MRNDSGSHRGVLQETMAIPKEVKKSNVLESSQTWPLSGASYSFSSAHTSYTVDSMHATHSVDPAHDTHTVDPMDITYGSIKLLSPWFPQIDPENDRAKTFSAWKSRRGVVLWTAFSTTFLVFALNIVLTALSWTLLSNDSPDEYLRNLYTGECEYVKVASVMTHLIINILSTLMLSASNLCMQLIAAPSRKDIDIAHSKGIWLDIGVPSVRNWKHIPGKRRTFWAILVISSLPIHFL
jgi:hypothetical protein